MFTLAMYYFPPVFGPHQVWPGHSPDPGVPCRLFTAGAISRLLTLQELCVRPRLPSLGELRARSRAASLTRLSRLSRLRRPSTCQAGYSTPLRGLAPGFSR